MTVQIDNATYVPMGDGKKWALKNVGASSPSDYGDYFAWGETAPYYQVGYSQEDPMQDGHWLSGKSGYNWANYGFTTDGGSTFTKYTGSDYAVLQAADDAATKQWGSSWCMPTNEEWQALLKGEDFTWTWVTNFNNSGKNGRLVISRKSGVEGNCIFLPAPCRFGGRAYAARPFKVSARPLKGLDGPLVSVGFPQSSLDKFAACLGTQTCETRLCRRGRWCCS